MVQTANSTTDKAVGVVHDATAKIMPAKQALAVAPDIEKATVNISNAASGILAIFQRNMEAFAKTQQIIMDGNKAVHDKRIDLFKSSFEQAIRSSQDIIFEGDLRIKVVRIF